MPPSQKSGAKYENLKNWLINRGETETNIQVGFADIEILFGEKLPDLAKQHRSWWSNDNKYKQSLAWLEVGWRIEDVDLDAGTVNFRRTVFVILQLFFSELLHYMVDHGYCPPDEFLTAVCDGRFVADIRPAVPLSPPPVQLPLWILRGAFTFLFTAVMYGLIWFLRGGRF